MSDPPGGSIIGRVSLVDKFSYPTGIRVTSEDGFEIEQSLAGKHEEPYRFPGLSPGKWTIDLVDDRQPTHLEVLQSYSAEVVGEGMATVDF